MELAETQTYHRELVTGCGTGRCGTSSLARLLQLQPSTSASHESFVLPWDVELTRLEQYIEMLVASEDSHVLAEIGFFILPYIPILRQRFPGMRVICLKRDREETIESYLKKTPGRNHWTHPTSVYWCESEPDTLWDPCYPKFDAPKREAIGMYWDLYYRRAHALESGWFRVFPTESLNEPSGVGEILDFAGCPHRGRRVEPGIRLNRG